MTICNAVLTKAAEVADTYRTIRSRSAVPAPIADLVSDPAAVWAAEQAIAGRPVPMNEASLAALTVAHRDLTARVA